MKTKNERDLCKHRQFSSDFCSMDSFKENPNFHPLTSTQKIFYSYSKTLKTFIANIYTVELDRVKSDKHRERASMADV